MSDQSFVRGAWNIFRRNDRGSIAIMSAASMAMILSVTAIAVDVGALYTERRHAQGAVDLAAIAAAADMEKAHAAAIATLEANNIRETRRVTVEIGRYTPDPRLAPAARFVPGAEPPNAARVFLEKQGAIYFARALSIEPPNMSVSGMAINTELANFSVGSRLLSLNGGLINQLLSSLTGSSVNLSVMDYEALAKADVRLLSFLDSLAGRANLTAGTYNDVLAANATIGDIVNAIASVSNGDTSANGIDTALSAMRSQLASNQQSLPLNKVITLGPLGDLGVGTASPGLDASYSALGLVTAAAAIANGTNQVALNLGANIPGLLGLTISLTIGEPMQNSGWVAVGAEGTLIRTAQTRIKLRATVGGTGLLAGAAIKLPVDIEIAGAEARLDEVACGRDGPELVKIGARPSIAEAWIGDRVGGSSQVAMTNIVSTPLVNVRGRAHVRAGNTEWTPMSFTKEDIDNRTIKSVDSHNLLEGLVSSLVKNLELQVQVLGLGIGLGPTLSHTLLGLLGNVTAPLDAVVFSLLEALGIRIGEADVRVHGALCGGARLAG